MKVLEELLRATPLELDEIRAELEGGAYPPEHVTKAALEFLDDCFDEQVEQDWMEVQQREKVVSDQPVEPFLRPKARSACLPQLIELLLEYGLEPNAVYDGRNVMHSLQYIDNGYTAADALALLLEHGGEPDTELEGSTVFRECDHAVIYGAANQQNRRRYNALVHCWFVLLGYGAEAEPDVKPVETFGKFELCELKQHRNFTFALTCTPRHGKNWSLHIIDRRDFWEVACL